MQHKFGRADRMDGRKLRNLSLFDYLGERAEMKPGTATGEDYIPAETYKLLPFSAVFCY